MSSSKNIKKRPRVAESSDSSGDESSADNTFQLSKNRYLTVSEFKTKVRVDIREYYLDGEGQRKPTRKGISLSLEEWKKITDNLDNITNIIKKLNDDSD